MPARGDHDRRRDVSEAVWRVLSAGGFGALTMRAVAAAMNASTGLLTHYFATKRELMRFALVVARSRHKPASCARRPGKGSPRRARPCSTCCPLKDTMTTMNRVWVSAWDAALGDQKTA